MVMGSSLIRPQTTRMAILRDWQLSLCQGDHCSAMLLNHFDYWHSWKLMQQEKASKSNDIAVAHGDARTQDESLLQFHTLDDLSKALMGLFGRTKIGEALKLLERNGFITKHANPNPRYNFDKTVYYLFHPEKVNNILREKGTFAKQPEKTTFNQNQTLDDSKTDIDSSFLNDRESKSELPSSISVLPSSKYGRYTKNTYKNTNKETTAASQSRREDNFAAAAFSDDDLLIREGLTAYQKKHVSNLVDTIHPHFKSYDYHVLLAYIEATLLSPTAFNQTHPDFHHKLNAIKSALREGKWSPPTRNLIAKENTKQKILNEWKAELSQLKSKLHDNQLTKLRFEEWMETANSNTQVTLRLSIEQCNKNREELIQKIKVHEENYPDLTHPKAMSESFARDQISSTINSTKGESCLLASPNV